MNASLLFRTQSGNLFRDQSGNDIFYSDNKEMTLNKVKNKYKSKYEENILVWISISGSETPEPYFRKPEYAIGHYM